MGSLLGFLQAVKLLDFFCIESITKSMARGLRPSFAHGRLTIALVAVGLATPTELRAQSSSPNPVVATSAAPVPEVTPTPSVATTPAAAPVANSKAANIPSPIEDIDSSEEGKSKMKLARRPNNKRPFDVASQSLRVVFALDSFKDLSDTKSPVESKKLFVSACNNLAKSMLIMNGPWGQGAFTEHSCHMMKELAVDPALPLDWVLRMERSKTDEDVVFRLLRMRPDSKNAEGKLVEYNRIKLPFHEKFLRALNDREFADFVAHAMLSSVPTTIYVPSYTISGASSVAYERGLYRGKTWRSDARFLQPTPIEKVSLYRVAFDPIKNDFITEPAGKMNFSGFETEGGAVNPKDAVVNLRPVWKIDAEGQRSLKLAGKLWGKRPRESKKIQARLNRIVVRIYRYLTEGKEKYVKGLLVDRNAAGALSLNIFEQIKSLDVDLPGGYVGVRYGASLIKDDLLLSQTTFFGLLAQVKAGPLEGFTFYWDYSPKVEAKVVVQSSDPTTEIVQSSATNFINWSRIVVGYGFDLTISDFRFDFTPKIGQWNFQGLVSSSAHPELEPFAFSLNNSINVGYELGFEFLIPLLSARAWVGQDGAYAVGASQKKASVDSLRGGIDLFYTVGEVFSIGPRELGAAILGFAFFDWIEMTNPPSDVQIDESTGDEVPTVDNLKYISAFVGLGITLSW
jgi:hypothetical protein